MSVWFGYGDGFVFVLALKNRRLVDYLSRSFGRQENPVRILLGHCKRYRSAEMPAVASHLFACNSRCKLMQNMTNHDHWIPAGSVHDYLFEVLQLYMHANTWEERRNI